jgi:hypothetical protein
MFGLLIVCCGKSAFSGADRFVYIPCLIPYFGYVELAVVFLMPEEVLSG